MALIMACAVFYYALKRRITDDIGPSYRSDAESLNLRTIVVEVYAS